MSSVLAYNTYVAMVSIDQWHDEVLHTTSENLAPLAKFLLTSVGAHPRGIMQPGNYQMHKNVALSENKLFFP